MAPFLSGGKELNVVIEPQKLQRRKVEAPGQVNKKSWKLGMNQNRQKNTTLSFFLRPKKKFELWNNFAFRKFSFLFKPPKDFFHFLVQDRHSHPLCTFSTSI